MIDGLVFSPGPPTTVVNIEWDKEMDVTKLPPLANWLFSIDSVPVPAVAQVWLSPLDLQVSYTGSPPIGSGILQYIFVSENLIALDGTIAGAPQSQDFFP